MNNIKPTCIICHGFNNHFDVPKVNGEKPATHRTAIVIKKIDFYDEWDVYDALFWRIVQRISLDLNTSIRIRCAESELGEMQSLEELRTWQKQQAATDSEFGIDVPTEIRFWKGGTLICLMTLEDWSDIGKVEPYSCSYTFSFYSYDDRIDESINESITAQLSQKEEVGEIKVFQECVLPKWYWPLVNVIKGDAFFIGTGFSILVLFFIVMIINSPSPSTYKKMAQSRRFLQKVRTVLLAADEKKTDKPFIEWRKAQGVAVANVPLAVRICEYCKEYSKKSGRKPFRTLEIDGAEQLIDPWGNPYNADMLDHLRGRDVKRALADFTANGIILWSSGPNGINEEGEGDDLFELPRRLWNQNSAEGGRN